MIVYVSLESNLSISFQEEDFQRINMNNPHPIRASFTDGESLF